MSGAVHTDGGEISFRHLELGEDGVPEVAIFKPSTMDEALVFDTNAAIMFLLRSCQALYGDNDTEFTPAWSQIEQFAKCDNEYLESSARRRAGKPSV